MDQRIKYDWQSYSGKIPFFEPRLHDFMKIIIDREKIILSL